MLNIFVSFLLICLPFLLCSCGGGNFNVAPKANPKRHQRLTKEERLKKRTEVASPERRKKHRQELKQREEKITHDNKAIKELTFLELDAAKNALIEEGDLLGALRYAERMLVVTTDLQQLKELRIEIADLNFDQGNLEEAENLYTEYLSFYPGSDLAEYASYKGILSCFYQTLSSDRDQSKTTQTVELAQKFLKQPSYKNYTDDVNVIKHQCVVKNFESELNVCNFYIEQDKFKSAEQRLTDLKEKYKDHELPFIIQLVTVESQLAQKQGNNELAQQKHQELAVLNDKLAQQYIGKQLDVNTKTSLELLRNNNDIVLPQALAPRKSYVNFF